MGILICHELGSYVKTCVGSTFEFFLIHGYDDVQYHVNSVKVGRTYDLHSTCA